MFVSSISKEELRQLPTGQFKGNIHLIEDSIQVHEVCNNLFYEQVLGFDTETRPSFKKGNTNRVSLLQLATSNDAYLFRLNKTGLPETLIKVLSNANILKVGIAIHDDIKHLITISPFKPEGFLELQNFVKKFGIENSGLSKLAGIILNFRISKTQQLSNWENEVLTQQQLLYAATDAWAAYEIYKALQHLNE